MKPVLHLFTEPSGLRYNHCYREAGQICAWEAWEAYNWGEDPQKVLMFGVVQSADVASVQVLNLSTGETQVVEANKCWPLESVMEWRFQGSPVYTREQQLAHVAFQMSEGASGY